MLTNWEGRARVVVEVRMSPCFIDIEASGLEPGCHPVEVGWATLAGRQGSVLIAPPRVWGADRWDPAAERLHGISRPWLLKNGVTPAEALVAFEEATRGLVLVSDAPGQDGHWLRMLTAAAGSRTTITLKDFHQTLFAAMADRLGARSATATEKLGLARRCKQAFEVAVLVADGGERDHRALSDALRLRGVWEAAFDALAQ